MQSQVQSISAATCARMSVDTLALGMFVSELDCPWADTPFLLHGLLLETEAELEVICRLCKEVTVDFSRSAGDFSRSVEVEDAAPAKGVAGSSADRSVEVANVAPARVTADSSDDRWQTTSARVEAAPEPGVWASIGRIFSELLSRQRIDPAEAALATGGQAVPLSDALPGDDLTARERDEAALDVERFEAELPRAALMLRQSAPVLVAVYDSAENDLPLEVETLEPVVTEIVDGVLRNQDAMLWLTRLQSHDQTAHARGLQAAVYMAHFGFHLGLPRADLECLALGGVLLDIGKMQVPKEILRKPGPLDADELRQARSHVEIGARLLDASGVVDSKVREVVERHHERENGSGYPGRMRGEAIGLYGRMAGIVDTFLAMSGARSYAPALPMEDCLRVLLWARGILFHAPLVEHFIQMTGPYPVGSLVELSTGEVAAVLSHNRARRLRPRVLVMLGVDGEPLLRPQALDLLRRPYDAVGEEIRIVRGLPAGSHGIKAADMFAATVPG